MTKNYQTITGATYTCLDEAFKFFNDRLFQNRLPEVMILLQRKRGAYGYFWAEQFTHRDGIEHVHEIALHPETIGRPLKEVLSTLVHEMTHLEQQEFGTPGKGGHHNKEWAKLMLEVGLKPEAVGDPDKMTGRKVSHAIIPGDKFDVACDEFLKTGAALDWAAKPPALKVKKVDLSKVPHICDGGEDCEAKVWGKLGVRVYCEYHEERMVPDPEWCEKHGINPDNGEEV